MQPQLQAALSQNDNDSLTTRNVGAIVIGSHECTRSMRRALRNVRTKSISKEDRAEVLLGFAEDLHGIEQPTTDDVERWRDWELATRVREHVAGMFEIN